MKHEVLVYSSKKVELRLLTQNSFRQTNGPTQPLTPDLLQLQNPHWLCLNFSLENLTLYPIPNLLEVNN